MKSGVALCFILLTIASQVILAQSVDWISLGKISRPIQIAVMTDKTTVCIFERLSEDKLFCTVIPGGSSSRQGQSPEIEFARAEVRAVQIDPYDYSKGFLSLLLAADAGGGWHSASSPTAFGGVKIGGPFALDLQYDRLKGRSGFVVEGSPVLPMFRLPGFDPFKERKFVKIYAEPGLGYRAGGPFGGYASAKVMTILLSDAWPDSGVSPYVEFQRRFPFDSPLDGDNRIALGVAVVLCAHCGFN